MTGANCGSVLIVELPGNCWASSPNVMTCVLAKGRC